ncbi:MAG TPA: hypothetical protein VFM65_11295 [Flavobacteriaceae bacterium]|nr:hypothetical protein [Flavobacteriaceae bacterium]
MNIFIAIGQNHVNNFEKLIQEQLVTSGINVLVSGSNVVFDAKYWDQTIISDRSFNNKSTSLIEQVSSITKKIKSYKTLIEQIDPLKSAATTIYISYIEDVLSNYLFFSFKPKVSIVVVEDGTLNYYDHSLKNIDTLKFKLKKIISFLFGIPFKKYAGHSSGAEDPRVTAQYLTFPKLAFVSKNAIQLPIERKEVPNLIDDLYFIGQESYGQLLGKEKFEELLKEMFSALKQAPFYEKVKKVYYKPHRNGTQIPKGVLRKVFDGKKIEIVNSALSSEDFYFEKAPCKHIAGFDSSTFPNIYSKLTDNDRKKVVFYVYPVNHELTLLFEKLNFVFLKN